MIKIRSDQLNQSGVTARNVQFIHQLVVPDRLKDVLKIKKTAVSDQIWFSMPFLIASMNLKNWSHDSPL